MEKPGGGEDANFTGDGVAPWNRFFVRCQSAEYEVFFFPGFTIWLFNIAMERSTISNR